MKLSFGSNVQSLGVQRYLSSASENLGKSFERLSSGMRINRASDDAAGIAIADRLRNDSALHSVAYRNINDGISLLNIVSGTLDQQTGILTRLSELAEQSANGTYSNTQRQSLSKEYYALVEEFGRLGLSASFNGLRPLAGTHNGTPSDIFLQAGISGGSGSQLSIQNSNTGVLSGRLDITSAQTGDITGANGQKESLITVHSNLFARVGNVNGREIYVGFYQASGYGSVDVNVYEDLGNGELNPVAYASFTYNQSTGQVSADGAQSISLSFQDGSNGSINLDFRGLEISSWAGVSAPNLGESSNIEFTSVEFSSTALLALDTIARRLADLNLAKGKIGALQSRLSIASQIAQISRETSLAAESRIRDIDVAEEAASLSALTIKQQAGASVLGIVNRAPELLLQLLKEPR